MKNILLTAIAASALMVCGASSVFAQSALDGAYAGLAGGYGVGTSEVSDATGNTPGVIELGSNGLDGEVYGGYGTTFDGVYVGIEAAVGYSDLNHATTLAGLDIEGKSKEGAALYGRVGYTPSQSTLLYGIAGLSYVNWEFSDGADTEQHGVTSYKLGIGAEQAIGDGVFARVSTDWDIARDPVRMNDANIEPLTQTTRLGFGVRF